MISLDTVLGYLREYRYLAMFLAIFLSALGLPLPEEITLIATGLAVGWDEADFLFASLACIAGILASDAFNFAMGRYAGAWFFQRRTVQFVLTPRRQQKIREMFDRHGAKAVFISRFIPVMRLGVHAYAGSHGLGWIKFLLIDLVGAVITGPGTILVGMYAARQIADQQRAGEMAEELVARGNFWVWVAIGVFVAMIVGRSLWQRRAASRAGGEEQGECTST
jgi:membrane protein DedA with SNARE-associated domain